MQKKERGSRNPIIQEALEAFMEESKLSLAEVGRIIEYDASSLTDVRRGIRPYAVVLSRLYSLTADKVFRPDSDREIEVHKKESQAPPESLTAYLLKKVIPKAESRTTKPTKRRNRRTKSKTKRSTSKPEAQKALNSFLSRTGLTGVDLARIIQCDNSTISHIKNGIRSPAIIMAKLYLISGDEAFKPKSSQEKEALKEVKQNLPKSLEAYMANNAEAPSAERLTEIENKPAIFSPWFDRILSGVFEIQGQKKGQTRFVVTAQSFQPLMGELTKTEVADTKLLLQELRRRFAIFAQLAPDEVRKIIREELEDEVNELYLALELCKEAFPFKAAKAIDEMRQYMENLKF